MHSPAVGQGLGLLHPHLQADGGRSETCNANGAISTSCQRQQHSSFHPLHPQETSPTATASTKHHFDRARPDLLLGSSRQETITGPFHV